MKIETQNSNTEKFLKKFDTKCTKTEYFTPVFNSDQWLIHIIIGWCLTDYIFYLMCLGFSLIFAFLIVRFSIPQGCKF